MISKLASKIEAMVRQKPSMPLPPSSIEELVSRARMWHRKNIKFPWPSRRDVYGKTGDIFFSIFISLILGSTFLGTAILLWQAPFLFWKYVGVIPGIVAGGCWLFFLYHIFGFPIHIAIRVVPFLKKRNGEHLQTSDLLSQYVTAEIEQCQQQTLGERSPIVLIKKDVEHVGGKLHVLKERFIVALKNTEEELKEPLQDGLCRVDDLLGRLDKSEGRLRSHLAKLTAFFEECNDYTKKVSGPLKTRQLFEELVQYEGDAHSLLGRIDEVLCLSTIEVEQALGRLANSQALLVQESGVSASFAGRSPKESIDLLEGVITRLTEQTDVTRLTKDKYIAQ